MCSVIGFKGYSSLSFQRFQFFFKFCQHPSKAVAAAAAALGKENTAIHCKEKLLGLFRVDREKHQEGKIRTYVHSYTLLHVSGVSSEEIVKRDRGKERKTEKGGAVQSVMVR